ncbi:MAG: hypothetical protein MJY83_07065 [Bacteroidales bacterium]|nr:hypothetical protein [Bacteroidales bacterium]
MKKIIDVIMAAAVMFAAICMTSCGGNATPDEPEKPEEIEMGHYDLQFETISVNSWPDSKESILKDYEAYQKSVTDALKIDTGKKYKWSEIEAEKARLQKAFDELGGFEFKVKSALNIFTYYGGITFKAYKEGKSEAAIDFGKKEITCIKDIPEGTTSQLYFVMESAEAAAPSTKEYCEKVRKLFAEALKDVFTEAFGEVVTNGTMEKHTFYNLANFPGDRDEVVAQMKSICGLVEVPALSDEMKKKALEECPTMNTLLTIVFTSYDPFVYAPSKSDKKIFDLKISVK